MDPSPSSRAETPAAPAAGRPPADGVLAALDRATGWLNSPPLTADGLRGRAVLVQFWTYTCINWLRTLPYVRGWAERYAESGLVVVGVHTPEFEFERDLDNVRRAVAGLGVAHPVAVDSDYAIWDRFGNRYWPALYLLDGQGEIRHHRFGEGDYERTERVLRQLLPGEVARPPVAVEGRGIEAPADWDSLGSPENYLGYGRTENFASGRGAVRDAGHVYALPDRLPLNHWALAGDWTVRREAAVLNRAEGRIAYRFHARDLHLVLAPGGRPVRLRVSLDGQPPGPAHGTDVDGSGAGTVTEPRLHQLIRQPQPVPDRTVEIAFLDPGVRAYAVTFG